MFGLPSLERIIALGTVPVMIAFAIVNYRQTWYSVAAFVVICLNTFYGVWFYLAFMYDDYRRTNDAPATLEPVRERLRYPDMSEPAYQMDVPAVTLDVERNFATELLSLFRSGADYKLTEQWWWDTGRWAKVGGSSKKQMQKFMKGWEAQSLLKKRNPMALNSTRDVTSWKKIHDIAQGRKMTTTPPLTTPLPQNTAENWAVK